MRNHILERLAYLANALLVANTTNQRETLAAAALNVATSHHPDCPAAEGSP